MANVPAASPGPFGEAEWHELMRWRACANEVARLPARQAEAFWLRCVEQSSYADIGRQLKLDANTVGVLVHRGADAPEARSVRIQSRETLNDPRREAIYVSTTD